MFINKYPNNQDFLSGTREYCPLFRSGFVRNPTGIQPIAQEWHADVLSTSSILEIKKATPILGTIMGLGRLYSVWSTEDSLVNTKELLLHTLTGIIETLGLGILLLIAKILYVVIHRLWQKLRLCCCQDRYQEEIRNPIIPTISENFDYNPPESILDLSQIRPEQFENAFSTSVQGDPSKGEPVTVSLTVNPQTIDSMIQVTTQLLSNIRNLHEDDEEGMQISISQFGNIVGQGMLRSQMSRVQATLQELPSYEEEEEVNTEIQSVN
ncbi:hypothetical protein DZK34_02985 [Chlamydia abortus]|uniref:hypothetical protein n=1 Tax=Chlamydia abortus TaxID=83555 RepID=UPI0011EE00AA|nr:hypothetical protein [Chlamydia abortus]QEM73918.1 hypothetical protein DZK34_02985 [Chlamydia abortus]